ncbi:MAG: hypothetical protein JXR03_12920 [Cyclobacteriaceae bacterium]
MRLREFILTSLMFLLGLSFSCNDDKPEILSVEEIFRFDQESIGFHIEDNEITALQDTIFGLYYFIKQQGIGNYPTSTDTLNVNFRAKYLGASEPFSEGEGVQIELINQYEGIRVLLPYLREGGEIVMYLPRGFSDGINLLEFEVILNRIENK